MFCYKRLKWPPVDAQVRHVMDLLICDVMVYSSIIYNFYKDSCDLIGRLKLVMFSH